MTKTALFSLVSITLFGCSARPVPGVHQAALAACALPDPRVTPGDLCSASDGNFDGYRYPEQIAHCRRNVSYAEKLGIAASYGVDESTFGDYEFDHLIPLSIGGSDAPENIWPQPLADAGDKDRLEYELYVEVRDGRTSQADAVAQILAWRPACSGR